MHAEAVRSSLSLPRIELWAGLFLGSTLLFNFLDAILTITVVSLGLAAEANPLMAAALAQGPFVFSVVKFGAGTTSAWILWRHREQKLALVGIALVFLVYFGVMMHQLQSVQAILHFLGSRATP